jgi:hypothetical protein
VSGVAASTSSVASASTSTSTSSSSSGATSSSSSPSAPDFALPRGFVADFAVLVRDVFVAGVAAAFDVVFAVFAVVAFAAVDFAAAVRGAGLSASLFADVAAFVVAIR